jgi:hypothetical protein
MAINIQRIWVPIASPPSYNAGSVKSYIRPNQAAWMVSMRMHGYLGDYLRVHRGRAKFPWLAGLSFSPGVF